jgi:predicted nucleic acid-binding protein
MIIVDTDVVSELMRPVTAVVVRHWLDTHREDGLYTTSITLAEIRYRIERLPKRRGKEHLRATAEEVFGAFERQVLPFDTTAAWQYASVVTARAAAGLPINGFDAQIASICRAHDAALATRNLKGFQATGIELIDPWQI